MNRLKVFLSVCAVLGLACGRSPERLMEDGGLRAASTRTAFEPKASEQLSALGYLSAARPQGTPAAPPPSAAAPLMAPRATLNLKLIWTASLQVEVPNFRAAAEEVSRAALAFGGYVSDRQSSEDGSGRQRGQITVRIPSAKFDGAMSALKKLGRVKTEGVTTQDVTKAYADLETRLKVKRETATRLREILTRQTGKVSEVLEVEREIARVVEEIEQAEGERLYMDNLVSLSTITLTLYEPDSIVSPSALDPIIAALRQALATMGGSIASLILVFAGLLPWALAFYFVYRVARWRWRRKA